ncbi:MAG: hypothetical protein SH809_00570 [Rhodothermales bacterium]|nr:hypothetical protein [Rhodothermales bacterium]
MRIRNSTVQPRTMILALALLACATTASAQAVRCSDLLVEANQLYSRGAFDPTIALIDQCIALPDVTDGERRTAYRLKGLCFIGKGLEVDARESVRRLLNLVPDYEPDIAMDPPNFVAMIQEVRAEINTELAPSAEPQTQPPAVVQAPPQQPASQPATRPVVSNPRRKKSSTGKYVLAGLGAGAVGGLAFLLLKGGGDSDGGDAIANPPALPQ